MTRNDVVLAILAAAAGRAFTPVQLQKTAFLVTKNLPHIFDAQHTFNFQPYDYGPFDKHVYSEAELLELMGFATISRGRWSTYAATQSGIERGRQLLAQLPREWNEYIHNLSNWALSQSFSSLVKTIYNAYPEMRVNSIFKDPA
jgi:hypothetical protein